MVPPPSFAKPDQSSPSYPRFTPAELKTKIDPFLELARFISERGGKLHGCGLKASVVAVLQQYSSDALAIALAQRITGLGRYLWLAVQQGRQADGTFQVDLPLDLPKLPLLSEWPGAYVVGYNEQQLHGGALAASSSCFIDNAYSGISAAKPGAYSSPLRDRIGQKPLLHRMGLSDQEVTRHVATAAMGGAVGRVTRQHCSPTYRSSEQSMHYLQTGLDTMPSFIGITYFAGEARVGTAPLSPLEDGLLGLYEYCQMTQIRSTANPDFEAFLSRFLREPRFQRYSSFFPATHPRPLNRQVGLEGSRGADARKDVLGKGVMNRLWGPDANGRFAYVGVEDCVLFHSQFTFLLDAQPSPACPSVVLQVSFDGGAARADWLDTLDPASFANAFSPLVPAPAFPVFVLITWLRHDNCVRRTWLTRSTDPAANPSSRYNELADYLIATLQGTWQRIALVEDLKERQPTTAPTAAAAASISSLNTTTPARQRGAHLHASVPITLPQPPSVDSTVATRFAFTTSLYSDVVLDVARAAAAHPAELTHLDHFLPASPLADRRSTSARFHPCRVLD